MSIPLSSTMTMFSFTKVENYGKTSISCQNAPDCTKLHLKFQNVPWTGRGTPLPFAPPSALDGPPESFKPHAPETNGWIKPCDHPQPRHPRWRFLACQRRRMCNKISRHRSRLVSRQLALSSQRHWSVTVSTALIYHMPAGSVQSTTNQQKRPIMLVRFCHRDARDLVIRSHRILKAVTEDLATLNNKTMNRLRNHDQVRTTWSSRH